MIDMFATDFQIVLHGEKLFTIGGVPITNAALLGWIVSAAIVSLFVWAASRIKLNSSKSLLITIVELVSDGITNLAADVIHDRKRALKFAPFLITLFCFILFNNWAGLLPGVGAVKFHGEPLFRAWTSDLTGTLALAITSIVIVLIYSARELGSVGLLKHYFSDKPWNPVNLFIGFLEILGEFTRVASLSLRLFGNIFAGEVLLIVISAITAIASPVATLPFIFMEFFVGFIQAFVFTTLVIVYLALSTAHHGEANDPVPDLPDETNTKSTKEQTAPTLV